MQDEIEIADSDIAGPGWDVFSRPAPMTRAFNHLVSGTRFQQKFGRWPLPPEDPEATINDVIFARMIDPCWSAIAGAFVDKETAKTEALKLAPGLLVPETLAIIPMDTVRSVDDLHQLLQPFIGTRSIAKPAHASGAATFLRDVAGPADLRLLHDLACLDYAVIMREMQYWRLPRKVIVEAVVPAVTASLDDYKFHCVHGEPLLCQIDHGRFGRAWSRLFRMPDFAPMDEDDGLILPDGYDLPTADRRAAMLSAARALAAPFDFVRVDLYDGADGIHFSELTFTPAASLGIAPSAGGAHAVTETHRRYSRIVMDALRRGHPVDGAGDPVEAAAHNRHG